MKISKCLEVIIIYQPLQENGKSCSSDLKLRSHVLGPSDPHYSDWILTLFSLQAKKEEKGKDAKGGKTTKADPSKKAAKAKKKTWTKVKIKDKLNNDVFLDEKKWSKIASEIPKILCITRSTLSDKYKVNGSIARAMIKELAKQGTIRRVGEHHANFDLYTGVQAKSALEKAAEEAAAAAAKKK